ncbi:tRNA uridine-5-carboxymethylaminomethyl(34) synthesis GTPase MnmE [Minwuia thermotolerans]|uniref:tRNA uridine-5-carboxymethylaminomethyl(34) synthesis GTPase MnmE n=1 Tax=Minwuia thermotolerans TaxID=2056226 RepID=UPI0019D0E870|nr:tRNA uridine-5-carboxymethylaminomethyl(34) synthesis GTPase MnmE [Minwuia thermotolerans]
MGGHVGRRQEGLTGLSGADTICALSSAPGPAGVAVIRLSGPACDAVCRGLARDLPEPRRAALRTLRDRDGAAIDRGLVLRFPGPGSFTGEDVLELHVHGGRAIVEDLLAALGGFEGLRMAEPGEFTRRAFVNGRMDLTEAEGVADLIAAETTAQRRAALDQAGGALSGLYDGWRTRLLRHLAHLEAWLDFPDEELPDDVMAGVLEDVAALAGEIVAHLADARRGERLRRGLQVAIVGPPNAGKSTLLNILAERDVAIVSETPGTTRDVLEVHLDLGGWPVTLIDTAGLRETEDAVEREGVRRAAERMAAADVVLALHPADGAAGFSMPSHETAAVLIEAVSKADRLAPDAGADGRLRLSAATGQGLPELLERLTGLAAELMASGGGAAPTRARHRAGLADCRSALERAVEGGPGRPPELIAEDLRLAMRALGRITGAVDVEDLLDVIFRDFCIGK